MQLTEAALPGAVSSLRVLSCLLGANRASSVHRQWHEPKCLPRVSDVAVAVQLRAWEQSVVFLEGNAVQHHHIAFTREQMVRRLW